MGKTLRSLLDKPLFHLLLMAILGLLAYSNTFSVPFQFDDIYYITENYVIRDLTYFIEPLKVNEVIRPNTSAGILLFLHFKTRFIGYLTFALNYKIHGLDVTGYHIFNLAIHIFNAILVYFLVALTFKTPYFKAHSSWLVVHGNDEPSATSHKLSATNYELSTLIALFSALLFVSHPIQTQAVTFISQRLTSLATFFYLLSLVMYINFRLKAIGSRTEVIGNITIAYRLAPFAYYLLSLISAILAMFTKEIAFTLPFIITLYEFMFFSKSFILGTCVGWNKIPKLKRLQYLLPFLLTLFIIPLALKGTNVPLWNLLSDVDEKIRSQVSITKHDYLFTQFRVIVTYIRLLFLPINQNLLYDYPVYNSFFNPNIFLSFLFLLSIFGIGVYLLYRTSKKVRSSSFIVHGNHPRSPLNLRGEHRGNNSPTMSYERIIAFSIFWFFITLSIESSIIPNNIIFEHRLYLPSIGIFISINTVIFIFIEKLKHRWTWAERTIIGILVLIVIVLTGAAYTRNTVWQNGLSLWEDVVRKSPKNGHAYNNLGLAYYTSGRQNEAIQAYSTAIKIEPDNLDAMANLGVVYAKMGYLKEAKTLFEQVLIERPDDFKTHYALGKVFDLLGDYDEAIKAYNKSLSLSPDLVDAYLGIGLIFLKEKKFELALDEFKKADVLKPNSPEILQAMGLTHEAQATFDKNRHISQHIFR